MNLTFLPLLKGVGYCSNDSPDLFVSGKFQKKLTGGADLQEVKSTIVALFLKNKVTM